MVELLQALAEGTRLGIPITLSTDPRHSFSNNPATNFKAEGFSTWPESLGLAATDDPNWSKALPTAHGRSTSPSASASRCTR
ncbi:MAG: hypothetical protein WKH64_10915 [Chloroflexia bacterium]